MARIINNKLLFIHVAKTGGTFVREVFNKFGVPNWETGKFEIEDHYSFDQVLKYHPELSNLHAFGFVRHPVDWLRSRWAYGIMSNFPIKIKYYDAAAKHWMAEVWDNDIVKFLENVIEKKPGITFKYFNEMLSIDKPKGCHVYRYESINQVLINYLNEVSNEPICLADLALMPRFKDSSKQKKEIPLSLYSRIEESEKKLMDLFY